MGRLKLTIEEMQHIAKDRGGKCLSTEYVNNSTKLEWKCKNGHVWLAIPNNIKRRGNWCPKCARDKHRLTIEEMQKIAESKGGRCLSKKYIDNKTKLQWKCADGHIWMATPCGIKMGGWCSKCAIKRNGEKRRLTIEEMQEIAKSRGGECLTKKYVNSQTKIKWKCKEGHVWWATPGCVKYGDWCPVCGGVAKLTIEEMQEIAKSRGGKCLSTEYINSRMKLKWKCADGHMWWAAPHDVKGGTWCPDCTNFIGEKIFRYTLGCIFQETFLKVKPKWLMGNHKSSLELDAYCKKVMLAGEYNGDYWHKKEKRKINDKLTLKGCKKQGVSLLIVNARDDYENIVCDIVKGCDMCNVMLPDPICYIYYEDLPIYLPSNLMKMQEVAESRGGKCLSTEYINTHTKLEWQCKEGHIWMATPHAVTGGNWCPKCANKKKGQFRLLTIDEMQEIAESRGGKCLSKKYINSHTKLQWQCKKGHVWWAKPDHIKRERWCHKCGIDKSKLTIEQMQNIAKSRGGKCLSIDYINTYTKLNWQCMNGHTWMATPDYIKHGCWCIECKNNIKLEEMNKIAEGRGGNCLSTEYITSKQKLQWQCSEGHIWWARPSDIKHKKSWCPKCRYKNGVDKRKKNKFYAKGLNHI